MLVHHVDSRTERSDVVVAAAAAAQHSVVMAVVVGPWVDSHTERSDVRVAATEADHFAQKQVAPLHFHDSGLSCGVEEGVVHLMN